MAEKNSTGRRLISGCVSGVPTWTGNACRRERCAGGVRKPDCPGFRAPRSSILPSARDLGPAWPEGGAPEKPRGRRRDAHNPSLRAAVPGSAFLKTTKNGTDPTAITQKVYDRDEWDAPDQDSAGSPPAKRDEPGRSACGGA